MNYTRKPMMVEAIQYSGDNYDEVCKFVNGSITRKKNNGDLYLITDDWNVTVSIGNWIVKSNDYLYEVFYDDEFKEAFEKLEDEA